MDMRTERLDRQERTEVGAYEHPLSAWRTSGRPAPGTLDRISRLLDGRVTLLRRGWRHAGIDPAVAVHAAVDVHEAGHLDGPAGDVVMSRLLLHEANGSAAAAMLLRHARAELDRATARAA